MASDLRIGDMQASEMRDIAKEVFLHALAESSIEKAFERHVFYERGVLRVADDLYDISSYDKVLVVSIGKAAHTMVEALMSRLGPGVGVSGIACGPTNPGAHVFGFRYFKGGHPTPNPDSLRSAEAILKLLAHRNERTLVIFLLSGGGSSLVEKPISEAISLDDLMQTYKALVHSGAPIAAINAVRKHLSAVKGGRLAQHAAPAYQVSIIVSDVPENALDSLASGPTMPDSSTVRQCHEIVKKHSLLLQFPQTVRDLFQLGELVETPKQGEEAFVRSRWWNILSNASAQKAAIEKAVLAGFAVEVENGCDDWDYIKAADHLLKRARELRKGVSRVCLICGGEVTVTVKGKSGIGGRNQQLALYCSTKIAGENMVVLSAGTDGIDGNSHAAGAIVDGTTVARAKEKGIDIQTALKEFNATPLFESLGDAIVTGPTGNNVRDLRVILAW